MRSARNRRRSAGDAGLWGVAVLACVAAAVAVSTERGAFSGAPARGDPLPGLTVGDDRADDMPVVTSLRSGGAAEREGVRVGDHIDAIDGRRVRTVAMVREALRADAARTVALHVVRGDAVWQAAIDRVETDDRGPVPPGQSGQRHDAQDIAG